MLIKVNRKELTKHISIVQKAISQRTTMQILEGIKISAKNNSLTPVSYTHLTLPTNREV